MNWFLYVGGGFMFVGVFWGILSAIGEKGANDKNWLIPFSALLIWVWLCWRFL